MPVSYKNSFREISEAAANTNKNGWHGKALSPWVTYPNTLFRNTFTTGTHDPIVIILPRWKTKYSLKT
jgi:hypothetical protein